MRDDDRGLFGNEEIKNKFIDSENDFTGKKTTNNKFRKTKRIIGNSTNKYSRSTAKNTSGMKEDLVTASLIFNDLKKRNLTFLN